MSLAAVLAEIFIDRLEGEKEEFGNEFGRDNINRITVSLIRCIEDLKQQEINYAVLKFEEDKEIKALRVLLDDFRNLWIEQRRLDYEAKLPK